MWPSFYDNSNTKQDFIIRRPKRAAKALKTQLDITNNSVDGLSIKRKQERF